SSPARCSEVPIRIELFTIITSRGQSSVRASRMDFSRQTVFYIKVSFYPALYRKGDGGIENRDIYGMSRERELKEIAGDLRRYYEFQKEMGMKRVFRERKEEAAGSKIEREYPGPEEAVTKKRTVAREDRG